MTISVYSNSHCPACLMTKRVMDAFGIAHRDYRTDDHPEVVKYVKTLGVTSAPIVIVRSRGKVKDLWYGFRPSKLHQYARRA